jgi:hypothetical protein
MKLNRWTCAALFALGGGLFGCTSSETFHIEPGVRAITIHANTILQVEESTGEVREVESFKVEDDYKIELDWWLHQGSKKEVLSALVYVKQGNTASDIATRIALHINLKSGINTVFAEETHVSNFASSESGRLATEDVRLPDSVVLKRIKVTKSEATWREDYSGTSYLQIFLSRD